MTGPSIEREPWRALESSLAIQFVSKRHRQWSPDALRFDKQVILSAIASRQSAAQAMARLKSELFHFVWVALTLPEYAGLRSTEQRSEEELRSLARSRLLEQGPCSPYRDEILPILDWLDSCGPALDLFLGGFLEIRETWLGEIEFRFELWRARWRLDPFEVETRGHELRDLFNAGAETVSKAKRELEARCAPPHASPWGAR
ncbi:MAG TPA: hypothetical protein VFG41_09810 [Sphingomicrobium sp.]|nr:hypothetical protein [Sphingomicrobium sp.]